MLALSADIQREFPAHAAGVQLQRQWTGGRTAKDVSIVTVQWSEPIDDYQREADAVAEFVFERFPAARERDALNVTLVRSFSFGYAEGHFANGAWYDPADYVPEDSGTL